MNINGVRLRDITWGGRIRKSFQERVWKIAQKALRISGGTPAYQCDGNMLTSSEATSLRFLDGGVRDSRGTFDSSSGMTWSGQNAKAYILYELGYDAASILGDRTLPSHMALKKALKDGRRMTTRT